jgi:hypothetical protein
MKVRIAFTVNIDPDAWREGRGLPEDSLTKIRRDVQAWAQSEIVLTLVDEGVTA